eukprot:scaffold181068_cov15-Tisochrysis_lutea.AAC.1
MFRCQELPLPSASAIDDTSLEIIMTFNRTSTAPTAEQLRQKVSDDPLQSVHPCILCTPLLLSPGQQHSPAAWPEQRPNSESPGGCVPSQDPGLQARRQAVAQVLTRGRLVHRPSCAPALCEAHPIHDLRGLLPEHAAWLDVVRSAMGRAPH